MKTAVKLGVIGLCLASSLVVALPVFAKESSPNAQEHKERHLGMLRALREGTYEEWCDAIPVKATACSYVSEGEFSDFQEMIRLFSTGQKEDALAIADEIGFPLPTRGRIAPSSSDVPNTPQRHSLHSLRWKALFWPGGPETVPGKEN